MAKTRSNRVSSASPHRSRGTQIKTRTKKKAGESSRATPKQQGKVQGRPRKSTSSVTAVSRQTRGSNTSQRIKDLTVSRKGSSKWKPLSATTKAHVKQTITENITPHILNMFDKESEKKQIQHHLKTLCQRVLAEFDDLEAPISKEDYATAASDLGTLEDSLLSYKSQVDNLEKELEKQRRLLERDENKLSHYQDDMESVDVEEQAHSDKLHPLLRMEPINTLNLPRRDYEGGAPPVAPEMPPDLEAHGRRLAHCLAGLRDQADKLHMPQWLEAVAEASSSLIPGT